ncbi:MAG: hypothetical protein FJ399_06875 [Verrucomicrobia bacterium]|nr:hypothetical protein [Verrucomicrobiota bacterium]
MLREYALTPQVFSAGAFENSTVRRLALAQLVPEFIHGAGVVRNLADGAWEKAVEATVGQNDVDGSRLLKALLLRGTIRCHAPGPVPGHGEAEWISVAETEHAARPLRGVICSPAIQTTDRLVANITHLDRCAWWTEHPSSWSLNRSLDDYRKFFEPLFTYSRELFFVDQYLDPLEPNYSDFSKLLRFLHQKNQSCRVSIHRSIEKQVPGRRPLQPSIDEWSGRFQSLADESGHSFELVLRRESEAYLNAQFRPHDRFLISNVAILSLTNGFDTQKYAMTTMTLLREEDGANYRRFYERTYGLGVRLVTIRPVAPAL